VLLDPAEDLRDDAVDLELHRGDVHPLEAASSRLSGVRTQPPDGAGEPTGFLLEVDVEALIAPPEPLQGEL
jgi:hypothetical protein